VSLIEKEDRKIKSSADQLGKYRLMVKKTIEAFKKKDKTAKR